VSPRRCVGLVVVATLVAVPAIARAQADNSNSFTAPDVPAVARVVRGDAPWLRWLRDEPRRRDTHVPREGLTAAELGLLYGTDFAFGPGAEGPVPVGSP
jgi:hypothetical protein